MVNFNELLPIGSVVLLKNGVKRLMIYGVKQMNEEGQEFDYIGVLYPEGNMGGDTAFIFNHENIEKVCFLGMNDVERQRFIGDLEKFYNELSNKS